jgi:hypothetical protein
VITASVTTGGLGLALVILYANLKPWWKSNDRDPRLLGPFTAGFSLGALSTLCAGGVLGVLATWTANTNNRVGGHVVPGSTGQPQSTLARGQMGQLSPGGGLVVFILAVAVVLAWRATGKGEPGKVLRRRMAGGVLCGLTLALTVGVAGLLRPTLLALTNGSGDQLLAAINHGISL